jgi:hypothetical protein
MHHVGSVRFVGLRGASFSSIATYPNETYVAGYSIVLASYICYTVNRQNSLEHSFPVRSGAR